MYPRDYEKLIGKIITEFDLSGDREVIDITFSDGNTVTFRVEGDCCSYTWIENIENTEALIGYPIEDIQDITMPAGLGSEFHTNSDILAYYGLKITTTQGICTIDFRNDSNGYYGGSIYLSGATF